jgi:peroxisomal membrane protein 4
MWLFRHHRQVLQPSLQSSMQYLYNDSDVFTSVSDWILRNK